MKIGIIGAGFSGLSAAYKLSKRKDLDITVIEKESKPGGLALGYKKTEWKWSLEQHYHHWFASDSKVRDLASEIGHNVYFVRPKSSTFINGTNYQLDSPLSLLSFPHIPFLDRVRTGFVLFLLKYILSWKPLEKVTSREFLIKYMGRKSWNVLWEPLFSSKFGKFSSKIPASWFWARIKKRSPSLGYPEGGFQYFANSIEHKCKENGVKFIFNKSIDFIEKIEDQFIVKVDNETFLFDKLICTLPSPIFVKVFETLPSDYKIKLLGLKGIGAINLVLVLDRQFMTDGSYWLNINEKNYPFIAVVEHTNFMDKKYYADQHIIYIGKYLPHDHDYFSMTADELFNEFMPYLLKINPHFDKSWVISKDLFKAFFAQPIIPLNYSKIIPEIKTPIDGLYLANIQQVYPWDRGTNYAVELGEKAANLILKEN